MALVALDGVWKRYRRGLNGVRERVALRAVTLELDPGELVAVVGRRRSGRTTLLQVAAGMEPPTEGTVRFDGVDLAQRPMLGAPGGIGYCTTRFTDVIGTSVVEHVAAPLLGGRMSATRAQARAYEALHRVGAVGCEQLSIDELTPTETIRVAIARVLMTAPRLVLIDDPTLGVRPAERDSVLALLRGAVRDDGATVVMTADSAADLAGADRALTIDDGELRGETVPTPAPVVPLRRVQAERAP